MRNRSRNFFTQLCNIERATEAIDVTSIRDWIVTGWTALYTSVPCWFEPGSVQLVGDERFGMVPFETMSVYFDGYTDVRVNDRLLKGGVYYRVESVLDYTEFDFHVVCTVKKLNYAAGQ